MFIVAVRKNCRDVIGDGSTLVSVDWVSGDEDAGFVESEAPVAEPIAGNDADGGSFAVRAGASRPLVSDTGSTIIPGSMDPPPGDTNGGVSPSLQIG